MEHRRNGAPAAPPVAALAPPLAGLAARGVVRHYRRNTLLLTEGDPGDALFLVLQGEVKVFSTDANGREVTFGLVGAGDFFGELALDGGPRSASAIAMQPTACVIVPGACVRQHLRDDPDFAWELLVRVMRRARAATEMARQLALLDVYGRVVQALEGTRGAASAQAPIELASVTHQQLASRVGASREMVSRLLKDLERGGYVELGLRRITLKKKLPARW